jgi:phage shock protein A
MASLLGKIRIGVLAAAHELADKLVDLHSTGAVKQHIRDLERMLDNLEDAAAEAAGYRRTVTREEQKLAAQIAELDHNINFILSDEDEANDHLAVPMEARLVGLEELHATQQEEVAAAIRTSQSLDEVVSTLRAKHVSMVAQLKKLEAMERAAEAKERAAEAIVEADEITSEGADVSVDNVTRRIQERADVADVKLERAMGGMADKVEKDVVLAKAKARLAERKARLAAEEK